MQLEYTEALPMKKRQAMIVAGNTFEIIATQICDDERLLCIDNIQGIRSE